MTETITAFKGFKKDMTCREFQYVEGETYVHDGHPVACVEGFHAVTMPLDVLRYYPPTTSVYHRVELSGETDSDTDDSKVAASVIRIGARLELPALIKAQIDFVFSRAKKPSKTGMSDETNGLATASGDSGAATASGDYGAATASGRSGAATASGRYGAATASGDSGAATASGYSGAATASGRYGAATASGDSGAATASGYSGAATASGYSGAATASGDSGAATASGRYGAATASGDSGAATASGDSGAATASGRYGAATASGDSGAATASGRSGAATASGRYGAATASGRYGRARGSLGCALFLAERDDALKIIHVAAVIVDGDQIKADTFYTLRGGKVVEA